MDSRPVDSIPDEELESFNKAYRWVTYCLDAKGRRVGNPGGRYHPIPHPLTEQAHRQLDLKDKTVVEFGCFEGSHTIALCGYAKRVVALDIRKDNLEKAQARCSLFGVSPEFVCLDAEINEAPNADVYFHSGVLYHLQDPVHHLYGLARKAPCLVLDTHYAGGPRNPDSSFTSKVGKPYKVHRYGEIVTDARAGIRPVSHWLTYEDLVGILRTLYSEIEIVGTRKEPNGLRITVITKASKLSSL